MASTPLAHCIPGLGRSTVSWREAGEFQALAGSFHGRLGNNGFRGPSQTTKPYSQLLLMIPSLLITVLRQQTVPSLPRTKTAKTGSKEREFDPVPEAAGSCWVTRADGGQENSYFPPHQNEVSRLYPGVNNLLGEGPDAQT